MRPVPTIALRPTTEADLEFVTSSEWAPENARFVQPWTLEEHRAAIVHPDVAHRIVEAPGAHPAAGYVILRGLAGPHRSVELKRVVLQPKGLGLGRECVRQLKRMAFRDLRAHRFWLDVKSLNTRALALYQSEGFVEEGRLRESVRILGMGEEAGYDSLVVMSLLDREYQARLAMGLEGAAS